MKKIFQQKVEHKPDGEWGRWSSGHNVTCYELKPNRRIITVRRYESRRIKKDKYELPFPYINFMFFDFDEDEYCRTPNVFATKESIVNGPIEVYNISILPNMGDDGNYCAGYDEPLYGPITGDFHLEMIKRFWNTPFFINPGDGFDVEYHIRQETKLSKDWLDAFGQPFSFTSWQSLSDNDVKYIPLDFLNSSRVTNALANYWKP